MRDPELPTNPTAGHLERIGALETLTALRNTLGMAPSIPIVPLRRFRSWPKHPQKALKVEYEVLGDALSRSYSTDAHFAAYTNPRNPYRLTNALAPVKLKGGAKMVLFVADVDDAEAHKTNEPSSDDWWNAEQSKIKKLLRKHPGAFIYQTRGGYRIVYLLAVPIFIETLEDVERWKARYNYWLSCLQGEFEIVGDRQCKYWSCVFRLPLATKETGQQPWDVIGDQHEIGIWDVTPSEEQLEVAARTTPRLAGPPLGDDRCDKIIEALVASVSTVASKRHLIYHDLGGALAQRGVTSHEARYIGEEIAKQAGDSSAHDRGRVAESSADQYYAGATLRGFGSLKDDYPEIAEALDTVLPEGKRDLREGLAGAHEVPPPINGNPAGLTVQYDPPGLGKTYRAAMHLASQGRGIIAVGRHAVAKELYDLLSGKGYRVQWQRSPVARCNTNAVDEPNCKKITEAEVISDAGGSVHRQLCRECEHHKGCPALKHFGDSGGVIIAPHQLLAGLCKNPNLPVVVDETPQILDKNGQLTSAAKVLRYRDNTTLLDATANWIELKALRHDLHAAAPFQRVSPPIKRKHTVLYAGSISKQDIFNNKQIVWSAVSGPIREALKLARAAGITKLLFVTHKALAQALRSGASPLEPEIGLWNSEGRVLDFRWYWNMRGENQWDSFDGCVTLGDPFENPVAHEILASELGLTEKQQWRAYVDRARAELAQCHGRLRDVRRPNDSIWHLHVGKRAPRGWTDADTKILDLPVGRPSLPSEMDPAEVKQIVSSLGGQRQAERILAIPRTTLQNWASGKTAVPRDKIGRLRSGGGPR